VRAHLAEELSQGTIVAEGLIAHGRGEAFDYLLGERTLPSARRAERMAARWLRAARRPVLSVNGNVAALAAPFVARLQRARPGLGVEVNLFHRSPARLARIGTLLRRAGVPHVLGLGATTAIPRLPSDRARVDPNGIARADLCVIPLEDGDRAEALKALGKRVVSIDLNPLSRTSQAADLPVVDELTRAFTHIEEELHRSRQPIGTGTFPAFDAAQARRDALRVMGRWATRGSTPRRA
jgi:4-phosphopantoate--beta-alanine ligase